MIYPRPHRSRSGRVRRSGIGEALERQFGIHPVSILPTKKTAAPPFSFWLFMAYMEQGNLYQQVSAPALVVREEPVLPIQTGWTIPIR